MISTFKTVLKSVAYLHIGPVASNLCPRGTAFGNCPVLETTPGLGLWPKTPLKKAGILILPPISKIKYIW